MCDTGSGLAPTHRLKGALHTHTHKCTFACVVRAATFAVVRTRRVRITCVIWGNGLTSTHRLKDKTHT